MFGLGSRRRCRITEEKMTMNGGITLKLLELAIKIGIPIEKVLDLLGKNEARKKQVLGGIFKDIAKLLERIDEKLDKKGNPYQRISTARNINYICGRQCKKAQGPRPSTPRHISKRNPRNCRSAQGGRLLHCRP
jgi:hypothetical protein